MGRNWKPITDEQKRLAEENEGLVWEVINGRFRKFCPRHEHDMYQEGFLGLMDAARRYDPTRGFEFSTFACNCIRGAIMDALPRLIDSPVFIPKAAWVATWAAEPKGDARRIKRESVEMARRALAPVRGHFLDDEASHDRGCEQVEVRDAAEYVRGLIRGLHPRQRQAMTLRYGLGGKEMEMMLVKDVARRMKVTHQQITNLEAVARHNLLSKLDEIGLTRECFA